MKPIKRYVTGGRSDSGDEKETLRERMLRKRIERKERRLEAMDPEAQEGRRQQPSDDAPMEQMFSFDDGYEAEESGDATAKCSAEEESRGECKQRESARGGRSSKERQSVLEDFATKSRFNLSKIGDPQKRKKMAERINEMQQRLNELQQRRRPQRHANPRFL